MTAPTPAVERANRHHAHMGDHLVMALAGAAVVVIASIFWPGLVRLFGGVQ